MLSSGSAARGVPLAGQGSQGISYLGGRKSLHGIVCAGHLPGTRVTASYGLADEKPTQNC